MFPPPLPPASPERLHGLRMTLAVVWILLGVVSNIFAILATFMLAEERATRSKKENRGK